MIVITTPNSEIGRQVLSNLLSSGESIGVVARDPSDLDLEVRIRTEGTTRGKVMDIASALSDGIGPRLTGSPNRKKANEWPRDTSIKVARRTRISKTGANSAWAGTRSTLGAAL